MSVHVRARRTTVLLAVAASTAVGLAASPASADSPAPDQADCATSLARAAGWPGGGPGGIQLVSDAYVSRQSLNGGCAGSSR